jgi:SAM-dependent methyltransferase
MKSDFFDKEYFFGKNKSNYQNYQRYDNDWYWRPFLKLLEKCFQLRGRKQISVSEKKGRVLELGCAFGFFLKRLQPFFDEVYGGDISEFAINQAEKNLSGVNLDKVDLNEKLNYPNEHFDCIVALDVLEHTDSLEVSMQKIVLKLKKEGCLLISLPVKDTWAGKIFQNFDKDKSHTSVPNLKELENIFAKLNLEVIKKRFFWNVIFFQWQGIPVDVVCVLKFKK